MDEELFDDIPDEAPESEEAPFRRRYRKKKKRKIPVARILAALFALFLLVYASMLIYTSNFTMLETEQADFYELSDCVEAEAFILRDEEYITNSKKGIISYTLSDGEKVNAGGTVARLFSSEKEVEDWQKYNDVKSELTLLEQMTSTSDSMFVNLDTVDAQIRKRITDYKNETAQNKLNGASAKLELLRLFNERTVVTGGSANFDERIAQLREELDSIHVSEGVGSVKSKKSGFFGSKLDGFESALDYTKAEKLSADDVKAAVMKEPPSDAVGKIVKTINWYLLCPVTSEQALTIASGDTVVDVSIPRVMSSSIPATVLGVNQSSKTADGLLVMKSDYMDGTIADIRRENITIKTYTYSGLRVSKSAIHEDYINVYDYDGNGNKTGQARKEKVQGVYVVHGKRLQFVQVKIIYSDNDFVICSDDPTDPEILGSNTITLHDTVVVKGKELYDGKIVR